MYKDSIDLIRPSITKRLAEIETISVFWSCFTRSYFLASLHLDQGVYSLLGFGLLQGVEMITLVSICFTCAICAISRG